MSRHGRVLVAMSGGVDSSVTAVLLHEAGYEVVGATMKTWDYETSLGGSPAYEASLGGSGAPRAGTMKVSGCCSLDDMNDARAVAVKLGATHLVVDLRDEFGTAVTDRFVSDYLGGRTPNPCVLCNTHVKWGALVKRADALGCEHIATGHYARVGRVEGPSGDVRHAVSRGVDRGKDQSYVLWGVAQAHLARTLLPLGGYAKPEIRSLAAGMGLAGADKKDSYEICFVPDDDYRGYLRRRVPGLDARVDGGPFVHAVTGETVGTHRGAPFYTVGQRRGLGLALGEPAYVTAIDPATNTVTVGPREALAAHALSADGVVWGAVAGFGAETTVLAQVRAHGPAESALVRPTG
ncbi:MAG TPA: tRNA 2-thiouridine(34) synthase MnmA, partial [Rubricoccaceae bacterium]